MNVKLEEVMEVHLSTMNGVRVYLIEHDPVRNAYRSDEVDFIYTGPESGPPTLEELARSMEPDEEMEKWLNSPPPWMDDEDIHNYSPWFRTLQAAVSWITTEVQLENLCDEVHAFHAPGECITLGARPINREREALLVDFEV